MDPRERVLTTFDHNEPDQVPLFEAWIEPEIIIAFGERDSYKVREKLGLDAMPCFFHPIGKTQSYGHGIDEWGRVFKNGQYGGGVVNTFEDLDKYTVHTSHAQEWFPPDKIKAIKDKYKEKYALFFAWHDCSLGLSYLSMGIENFFSSLYERPEFVKAVIERSTQWIIALVEQANQIDVDFIILGDDAADKSRALISPKMFRNLILPEYKKIVNVSDVPIVWHSDGNISSLLPIIIEAGILGVHSLEPNANINLTQIKEQYGDKLVLAGNLDTTEILCQSNLEVVRKDVERCIRQGAPKGGYLFSSSNSLFEGHNIEAILEAFIYAKKIGIYPINI
ncbi:MAG: uroporphyrinogen decarboxylase family protein [Candidatus Hodarchaeota archaeon]